MGGRTTLISQAGPSYIANFDTALADAINEDAAVQAAIQSVVGGLDAFTFQGFIINSDTNPNYPAADAGDTYKITTNAGKVGGASGKIVQVGDTLYCDTDSTASGDEAAVGSNWAVLHGVIVENDITMSDNTDNNASTTKHGFVPKLPNDADKFYNGVGGYTVPAGNGVTGPVSSIDEMIARHTGVGGKTLQSYTSNAPTIGDDGEMVIRGSAEVPNGAGKTVTATGQLVVDTTSKTQRFHDGTAARVLNPLMSKDFSLEDPSNSEDRFWFHTKEAITITELRSVLVGSSTPSLTWTIRHSTDRSAVGNEVVTSGTTTTSVTTGDTITSFNDATIPANSFVFYETTAQSGVVNEHGLSAKFLQDV